MYDNLLITASFWINPQFKIHIDEADDDDDDGNGTIIVGVMQKDRRKARNVGEDNHTIGYAIYGVNLNFKSMVDLKHPCKP